MQIGVGVLGATGYIGAPYRQEIRQSGDLPERERGTDRRWRDVILDAARGELVRFHPAVLAAD